MPVSCRGRVPLNRVAGALCALLVTPTALAGPGVATGPGIIYSTFTPEQTYVSGGGTIVRGPDVIAAAAVRVAVPFTPAADAALKNVQVGMANDGQSPVHATELAIFTSTGSGPGVLIESLGVQTSFQELPAGASPTTYSSTLQPTLLAGTEYFVVARWAANDSSAVWAPTLTGVTGRWIQFDDDPWSFSPFPTPSVQVNAVYDGDECAVAGRLQKGENPGSLVDNTGSTGDDSSCAFNDTIDAWHRYTAPDDGTLTLTTCHPGTEFDTVLSVFDACAGTQLACNDDTSPIVPACELGGLHRKSTVELDLASGQSVFVRVSVFNDDFSGSFGTGEGYVVVLDFVPEPPCPCDWNGDGALNDQDFFDWVNDFFDPDPGKGGGPDFNGDGSVNDQDWFDFVNCFFGNVFGC